MEKTKDKFIMLPTVDFCFKELMQNPKVRKGFVAAILKKRPEEIRETILLPTILRKGTESEKQGILFYLGKMYTEQLEKGESYEKLKKCIHVSILNFVHFPDDEKYYRTIHFCDVEDGKEYTDLFELQILELSKLPKDVKSGEDIVQWMRFFNGKNQEEFEKMAKENEYLDAAYQTLKEMSADEQKRVEYEAREKALKDYNTQMSSSLARGLKRGEEIGLKRGIKLTKQMIELKAQGNSIEEIAEACGTSVESVKEILL